MQSKTDQDILKIKLKKTKQKHLDKNNELLKSLESTIGTVKPKLKDRDEDGEEPSLFYNNRKSSKKVSMDQLLACMDDKTLKTFKNAKSVENYKACEIPENSEKVAKRTRREAYKTSVKDMNKWDTVIHQYRDAKKVKFGPSYGPPLEPMIDDWINPDHRSSKNDVMNNVSESTSNNKKMMDILGSLSNRERKALHKLQLEKALEQRNQLRKLRLFESNINVKNNYIRKIKSKNFRRRLRLLKKRREANDIGETQEEMDNVRATERALLKHKKKSKWEKRMKILSHKLTDAKEALIQHQETGNKLINETKGVSSDDDDVDVHCSNTHSLHTRNNNGKQLTKQQKLNLVNNPWLTEEIKNDEIYEIVEETNDPKTRFRPLVPINRVTSDLSDHSDDMTAPVSGELFTESEDESEESEDSNDQNDLPTVVDNAEEDIKMRAIVDAFGDNVIGREFASDIMTNRQRLKNEILDKTKDSTKQLPGWGSWVSENPVGNTAGASWRRNKLKNKVSSKKDPIPPLVIRNSDTNSTLDQIKVRKVPKGFANDKHIFNSSIRQPIGQLFNTPKSFKNMIQPKIQTTLGTIIEPLESEAKGVNISKVKALLRDMPKDIQNKLKSII